MNTIILVVSATLLTGLVVFAVTFYFMKRYINASQRLVVDEQFRREYQRVRVETETTSARAEQMRQRKFSEEKVAEEGQATALEKAIEAEKTRKRLEEAKANTIAQVAANRQALIAAGLDPNYQPAQPLTKKQKTTFLLVTILAVLLFAYSLANEFNLF